jgi:hypothetical protein
MKVVCDFFFVLKGKTKTRKLRVPPKVVFPPNLVALD